MQLSLSFPVAAASLSDASKSHEFLGYQLPAKSGAVLSTESTGDIFPS